MCRYRLFVSTLTGSFDGFSFILDVIAGIDVSGGLLDLQRSMLAGMQYV